MHHCIPWWPRDTPAAIARLQARGIEVVMCTGDHPDTAQAIAQQLDIHSVHSRVLPARKAEIVMQLQQQGFSVGMVGDGINDATGAGTGRCRFRHWQWHRCCYRKRGCHPGQQLVGKCRYSYRISQCHTAEYPPDLLGAFVYNTLGIPLAAGLLYPLTGWLLYRCTPARQWHCHRLPWSPMPTACDCSNLWSRI